MPEYLAPGVYVEEIDTGTKPIEGVSTSTAGMIGVTERGPVNVPILVTGVGEFRRWFGDWLDPLIYSNHCYLPQAVQGFFTNGGKRLWLTRVLDAALATKAITGLFDRGNPPIGSTLLLRAAAENTGTAANPPLLVALDGTNLAPGDSIRIGDGSNAEYREIAAPLAVENIVVPLSFPLSRSHAPAPGDPPIKVEQFTPAAAVATFAFVSASQVGDQSVEILGVAADIAVLAVNDLLEIGATANIAEHRFIRQITPISATNVRVQLDSPLMRPYPSPPAVRKIALGATFTANLAPSARAGDSILFVDTRGGNFDTRTDLVAIDSGNNDQREVRRIGELHLATISPAAAESYPAGTLVEAVNLADDNSITIAAVSAAGASTITLSDVSTVFVNQNLLVGPPPTLESVQIQLINPTTKVVTLVAPLVTGVGIGDVAIPVRRLNAAAAVGASFISLNNRAGLSDGDVLRVGDVPDDEYVTISSIPSRAAAGPDPGNVLLASPLVSAHALNTAVVRQNPVTAGALQSTVLALGAQSGSNQLLLADGNNYLPPMFVRLGTSNSQTFRRVTALTANPGSPGAVAPQMIEIDRPLDLSHSVGSVAVERGRMLDVEALDAGIWGNRLRVSVEDESPGLVSRTDLLSIGLATQATLASLAGVEPGTILELLDPTTGAPVGGPLKVNTIDRTTGEVTLAGGGLDPAQQAAHVAAIGAGAHLGVRSREFKLTVYLLRQPDLLVPTRNELVTDSETFRYLSMDPRHSRYVETVVGDINGPLRLSDRRPEGESLYVRVSDQAATVAIAQSVRLGPETLVDVLSGGLTRAARHRLRGGDDSIATLSDVLHYVGNDDPTPELRTGLQTLRNVEEISIVSVPGRTSVTIQNALINQCEFMRYRFAVLDGPRPPQDTLADVQFQRQQFDTKYAALYHPWLLIPNPFPTTVAPIPDYAIPPSGHLIGIYARTDIERGVHKAPANEVVRGITGLQRLLNKEQQEILNPFPVNINVIRDFRDNNRGIRVFGGRVITSDSDWKYVNVRRLLIFIEASIDRGLQYVVFEPNAEPLWARVTRSITNFLNLIWRNGALEGTKPEEAFFVKCDRTTMTQTDIDNGRLIVVIGVAPVKPAEFVIIRIGLFTARAD
jgi:phage tail sheath protein FI